MSSAGQSVHTASELLAYEPFVRSIARSLLADEDRVGDVVQETWLRALTRAPRSSGSFKSWLGKVTRNLALDEHRREGSRRDREQKAAREEIIREDEQGLELHSRLVEAVLQLEEPYRSVVMLRYYRGFSPARIARELDRKDTTVRSQLHRAHELLRTKLDGEYDGDRSVWMSLCAPLTLHRTSLSTTSALSTTAAATALVIAAASAVAILTWNGYQGEGSTPTNFFLSQAPAAGPGGDTNDPVHSSGDPVVVVQDERSPVSNTRTVRVSFEGQPAADVDVWCLVIDDIDDAAMEADPMLQHDAERLFPRFGSHSRSNEQGEATIPMTGSAFALLAVRETQYQILPIQETQVEVLEVELQEVPVVLVRTVDASGNPVSGVPIVLRCSEQSELGWSMWDQLTRETAGADGSLLLRAFDFRMARNPERRWSVRLGVPGIPSRRTQVTLDRRIDDAVVLEVAPTGSLRVETVDVEGEPLPLQGVARVRSQGLERAALEVKLVDGVAEYPLVGIDSNLEVEVEIPALGATWKRVARGPLTENEPAVVQLRDPGAARLTARIVNPEGAPHAEKPLKLILLDDSSRQVARNQVMTDSGGRIAFELESRLLGSPVRAVLLDYSSGSLRARAESLAPVTPTGAVTDLGQLQIFEASGYMEGHVRDEQGRPVPGVQLVCDQIPGFARSFGRSDAQGFFVLSGVFPESIPVRIEHADRWVLASPVQLTRGTRDAVVTVVPSVTVRGTVLGDEDLDLKQVEVVAFDEAEDGEETRRWKQQSTCDPETGEFAISGFGTGTYRLEFHASGLTLRTVEGIALTGDGESIDPRVELVDLRGIAKTLVFRVTDLEGQPVPNAVARGLGANNRESLASGDEAGEISLTVLHEEGLRVLISGHDKRDAILAASALSEAVTLHPGIEVNLTATTRLDLRRGTKAYFLTLQRVEEDSGLAGSERDVLLPGKLSSEGSATVRFPAPGRYRLTYSVHYDHSGHRTAETDAAQPVPGDFHVDVPEGAGPHELHLLLPEELPE